jgi:hypothetical protein
MPLSTTQLQISEAECAQRNDGLLECIDQFNVAGLVLFDADYI